MSPYEKIRQIANDSLAIAVTNGFRLDRCVWELSPSIVSTIAANDGIQQIPDPSGFVRMTYCKIPIRRNTDESTGIILRYVHQVPFG